MAAAVMRHEVEQAGLTAQVSVESAGTGDWHIGGTADQRAQSALQARGYAAQHTARQFKADWFADYDLVIALDQSNLRDLRRMADSPGHAAKVRLLTEFDPDAAELDIPDPYYGGSADFADVLSRIESACAGLLATFVASPGNSVAQ